jgi:hypothetical protein
MQPHWLFLELEKDGLVQERLSALRTPEVQSSGQRCNAAVPQATSAPCYPLSLSLSRGYMAAEKGVILGRLNVSGRMR